MVVHHPYRKQSISILRCIHFSRKLKSCRNRKRKGTWRDNAIQLTERYVKEGLQDRAVSRDLPIGVPIPVEGYEDKKIYVWIEAVTGYYSASKHWVEETGKDDQEFWASEAKTYYVHGKDNIPFHSVIWPAVLLGIGRKQSRVISFRMNI